jgi:hypothetical protein
MSEYRKISRRRFLRLLAVAGSFGSILPINALANSGLKDEKTHYLASRLIGVFNDKRSASIVGRAYLDYAPHEAEVKTLVAKICGSYKQYLNSARNDDEALNKLILESHRTDFANGRTVKVSGWVLSQTEARISALTAILSG